MSDLSDLLDRNLLAVFNERDVAARRLLLAKLYLPDARFADHDGVAVGAEAIDAKIAELQARTPGFEFVPGSRPRPQERASARPTSAPTRWLSFAIFA